MNPIELLKTQLIMNAGLLGGSGSSWGPIRNLIIMNVFDKVVATFPIWSAKFNTTCCRRKPKSNTPPPPENKEIKAEIVFERTTPTSQSSLKTQNTTFFQNRMDSVVHYVAKLPSVKNLISIVNHDYLPQEFDPILVDNDIYFQLVDMKYDDGTLNIIKFKIFCYEHDTKFIQQFVDNCNSSYERHMSNKLGTNLYFFNMMVNTKNKRTMQNPLPSSHLVFTKNKFYTTRSFDNVFFEQRDIVKNHTEFFLNRKDWYEKKGIPHTLGFMFHGDAGCGKTSTLKAIANVGHRHIINIHLSEIKSKEQLTHLFFNDEIHVFDNGKTERYIIPVNERMYVIEDIDAMGETVLKREWKTPTSLKQKEPKLDELGRPIEEDEDQPIDLSFLLNLLDGTLEASGRILAITTNFPERIDRALIRPGRIDMIINFKKCSEDILKQMVDNFYDKEFDPDYSSISYKWTPAEVNQILFRNFSNPEKAIEELKNLTSTDLYGFKIEQSSQQAEKLDQYTSK